MKLLNYIKKEKLSEDTQDILDMGFQNIERVDTLNKILKKEGYQTITKKAIEEIATKRLFECYTAREIMELLKYFNLLLEE